MLGKEGMNRVKKDAAVYKPIIAAKGLQTTSQTWRLIDWARQLPVGDWHEAEAGRDEDGNVCYWDEREILQIMFSNVQEEAFAHDSSWSLRRWEPSADEWDAVLVAVKALHGID